MEKINCTVEILTKNSEQNLERLLELLAGNFKEIIILDGGSTDKTLALAAKYQCRVIPQKAGAKDYIIQNFAETRNIGFQQATCPYFLYIDSDELIGAGLIKKIREIIERQETGVWRVQRHYLYRGNLIDYSTNYPDLGQTRFCFRAATPGFIKPVHERLAGERKKFKLMKFKKGEGIIVPVNDLSFQQSLTKALNYNAILRRDLQNNNFSKNWSIIRFNLLDLLKWLIKFIFIRSWYLISLRKLYPWQLEIVRPLNSLFIINNCWRAFFRSGEHA